MASEKEIRLAKLTLAQLKTIAEQNRLAIHDSEDDNSTFWVNWVWAYELLLETINGFEDCIPE